MKKKIVVSIFIVIIVMVALLLTRHLYNKSLKDFTVEKESDSFRYTYVEDYLDGNRWDLYINGNFAYSTDTFEGYEIKDMKEHLTKTELIKILVDKGKVSVYALALDSYLNTYDIIYTLDGIKYHHWNQEIIDINEYEEVEGMKNRLAKLYEYISEDELKKISEETWE